MGLFIIIGSFLGWLCTFVLVFHLLKFKRFVKLMKDNDITF